jgi:hypothetical protein
MPPPVQNSRGPAATGTQPNQLWTTDPRLWYIPKEKLTGRRDYPIMLSSPLIEQTIIQVAGITSPLGRKLEVWEAELVSSIYLSSVDTARIRVVEARIANAPTTLGNQIRVNPGWKFDTEENRGVLIHECAHVWQYQNHGTDYITDALYHQLSSMIDTGDRNAAYMNYKLDDNRTFNSYTAEEQAMIVEDFYQLTVRYKDKQDHEVPEWVKMRRPDLKHYERLMKQVRAAIPPPEVNIYERSLMTVPKWDMNTPSYASDRDFINVVPFLRLQWK